MRPHPAAVEWSLAAQRRAAGVLHAARAVTGNREKDPCDYIAKYADNDPALARGRVLVPVPRKVVTPSSPDPMDWPGLRIANALHATGYGKSAIVGLRRRTVVSVSSGKTSQADRVTVQQHVESLTVDRSALKGATKVTLIDDVLTAGTQLMGAMRVLQLAGVQADIMAVTGAQSLQNGFSREMNVRSVISWEARGSRTVRRSASSVGRASDAERAVYPSYALHQPDFGIAPYRAILGALRVKPDVVVRASVPADGL